MIELYKIFAGKYDSEITEWITGKCIVRQNDTRNHRFALQQSHIHYDIRKFSFSNRITHCGIVYQITVPSPTLNTFKAWLRQIKGTYVNRRTIVNIYQQRNSVNILHAHGYYLA